MQTNEIKAKIGGIKSQIVENSTVKNKARRLIADLLAAKGELDNEPTLVHLPMREVLGKVKGDTFTIYKTDQGMVYEMTNGFMLHIPRNGFTSGLYEIMEFLVDYADKIKDESEEIQDFYNSSMIGISLSFAMLFGMWSGNEKAIKFRYEMVERYALLVEDLLDDMDLLPADYASEAEYEKTEKAAEVLRTMAKEELEKGKDYGKAEDESKSHGEKDQEGGR